MKTSFSTIEGGGNLLPDVSCWIGATLLLSPKAYRLLGELLKPFGKFLPIWIDDQAYQIFNCLTVCSAIYDGNYGVNFDRGNVKNSVAFKPGREFESHLYCSELLKNSIQSFELKGVVFHALGEH